MSAGYEHQAVNHDASIRLDHETPEPGMVTVTITRGERKPVSIVVWHENLAEAMDAIR